jgi:hypothetical protein
MQLGFAKTMVGVMPRDPASAYGNAKRVTMPISSKSAVGSITDASGSTALPQKRPKQGLSTSKLDRRVSDQKAAKELAIIIRQLRVGCTQW